MLMQVKLLRLIQERTFTRVGGETAIKTGARIICATNTDLEAAVAEGCSRRDLYYRINVIPVVIPPLRDGRTTSCRSRNPSYASYRRRFTAISKASRRKPNRFCSSIPGPATCGRCATASRGRWQCYRRSRSMRRHFFHPRRGLQAAVRAGLGAAIPALGLPWRQRQLCRTGLNLAPAARPRMSK